MRESISAIVGAKITEFRRKMAEVKAIAKTIPNKIVVDVEARSERFQRTISRIANTMQSFDTIARNTAGGLAMMASPAIVPFLVTLIGLLGTLGPMLGVVAGSSFALVSAFGLAGAAALAFGAAAVPTITKLFSETEKLTSAQRAAKEEFNTFKSTWQGIVKELEKPVLDAFAKSMQVATKTLEMARPLFDSAAKAVNNLLTSLNASLDSSPVKAFFDYMNKSAGPMLETIGKAMGNFMQGLMSMMVAFGPLAEETAQGFLKMSKGFADWAAGLSKSEKFQQFVDYIRENMPKIRAIFRDALAGVTYFFAAFGPLSSDMMTSLQGMMGRFKEWARTLGENQQFQSFIGYIRDNAPRVIELIGNLTNFLINLGVGLAPIGSAILNVVNNILSWINSMMTAHPVIGQIIAIMVVLTGALIAIVPNIIAFATLFSGLGGVFSKLLSVFLPFKGSFITGIKMMGTSFLNFARTFVIQAARIAAGWLVAMGPIGWVTAAVLAIVALIIANWDTVKEWTIKVWTVVSEFVSNAASKILGYIKEKFPALYEVIKQYMEYTKKIISAVWDYIKGTFQNVLAFLKALVKGDFQGMKDAITNQMELVKSTINRIWEAIKTYYGTVLGQIWETVKAKFSEILSSVTEKMTSARDKINEMWESAKSKTNNIVNDIKNTVTNRFQDLKSSVQDKMVATKDKIVEIWNQAKSFLENIDLFQIGVNIIQGLINGIGSMASAVWDKVNSIAKGIKDTINGALDIHSPSRFADWVGRMFGRGLENGLTSMAKTVGRAALDLAEVAMINPTDIGGFNVVRNSVDTKSSEKDLQKQVSLDKSSGERLGITQNLHFYDKAHTPSETARQNLKASRQLAMELSF